MAQSEIDELANGEATQIGSGAWARASSDEDLEVQVESGFPGNKAYEAASRELARREDTRSDRTQLSWIKRTFWATIILGIAAVAVTLFGGKL